MLLLPVVAFLLLWVVVADRRPWLSLPTLSLRGAMVTAFLLFQLILLAITELTSLGDHFTAGTVAVTWVVLDLVLVVVARRPLGRIAAGLRPGGLGPAGPAPVPATAADRGDEGSVGVAPTEVAPGDRQAGPIPEPGPAEDDHRPVPADDWWSRLAAWRRGLSVEEQVWLAVLVAFVGVLAAVGALYLPSNTDSLAYHLARVAHWIQDRTVAAYATHYLAQVEYSPLGEYNLAHIHLLTGTDRFDAYVQLSAYVVCVVGVSELTRLLGGSRYTQIVAAVICATIPMGVLLATSSENDLFTAATGVPLLVVAMAPGAGRRWPVRAALLGVAAGIAYMAKGTMPVMVGPAVVAVLAARGWPLLRDRGWRALWAVVVRWGAVAAAAGAVVVGPFVVLCVSLFGSPTGPTSRGNISSPLTLGAGAANIVRTTANNFDIGNGAYGLSTYVARLTLPPLHWLYGLTGVNPNNINYTFNANPPWPTFSVQDYSLADRSDSYGADPWHVLLLAAAVVVLVVAVRRGGRRLKLPLLLAGGLTVGYLLFSGADKSSPYEIRYGVPLLVVWAAVIAIALAEFRRWVARVVMLGLVVACLPQLLDNVTMPLVPVASYNANYLEPYLVGGGSTIAPQYESAAYATLTRVVASSSCDHAALGNWILIEYPLWVGLQHDRYHGTLTDVDVHNTTRDLGPQPTPCAVFTRRTTRYLTPDNGAVNLQLQDLVLAIDPADLVHSTAPVPRFTGTAGGARVYPGGGWSLAALGQAPLLGGRGTLVVTSPRSQTVRIVLDQAPGAATQPRTVTATGPGGSPVAVVTTAPHTLELTVPVHPGVNRVGLVADGPTGQGNAVLALSDVRLLTATAP